VLAHNEHFADIIPGKKEFNGREIAEKIFDMPVVEDPLQFKTIYKGMLR
jgi:hypothetical protein